MPTLQFVREAKDTRLLLLGIIGEGESARYTVYASTFAEIGSPSVGEPLDEWQTSVIKRCDELIRAKKKALNILAYADNNRRNLAVKLLRAGFGRDVVDAVCDEMIALGYIDERRQLERIILDEANRKLRGPLKIVPALVAKGYSSSEVKETLHALVESGEIDFKRNAKLLLDKKLSDDFGEEEVKKILYKNGYKI